MGAELKIKISGDGSGFAATLDKAKSQASGFASHISGDVGKGFSNSFLSIIPGVQHAIANIFDPSAIFERFQSLVAKAKGIKLGSIRTQMDTDTFQRTSNALEAVGLDAGTATMAISKLAHGQEEVKNGSVDGTKNTVKLAEAYAKLGVSLTDLNSKTPQQLFQQIAASMRDASAAGKITGEQMSALRDVFGRAAAEMTPFFARGGDKFADQLNILDADQLKRLQSAGDTMKVLKGLMEETGNSALLGENKVVNFVTGLLSFGQIPRVFKGIKEAVNMAEPDEDVEAARKRTQAKLNEQNRRKAEEEAAALAGIVEGKTADKEEKAVADQRQKNLLAVSTPEEKRAILLAAIKKSEDEIAFIKAGADEAGLTAAGQRILIAKQELEIDKNLGELAQLDKGTKAPSENQKSTDRLTQIGGDVSRIPVNRVDKAAEYYASMIVLTQKQNQLVADAKEAQREELRQFIALNQNLS